MKYVALLRAVNVGGTGKLAMKDLVSLCTELGFENARTYIQSGNVVFDSRLSDRKICSLLKAALTEKLGKEVGVYIRTAQEMAVVLKANPFKKEEPAKIRVFFQSKPMTKSEFDKVASGDEKVHAGERELYIFYPNGMGRSKLKLPAAGTARNMNTVAKLVSLVGEIKR